MSKLKVSGNASGTGVITLEAPNTNTDRAITLPDSAGELINIAPSTSGNVLTSDGTDWTSAAAAGGGLYGSVAIICDEKAYNANGGVFTSGAWRTRDLNTEISDADGIVSISSNQFTLAAGTYTIEWSVPQWKTAVTASRLYNTSDSTVTQYGSVEHAAAAESVMTRSTGSSVFIIAGSKTFEIQHKCATTSTPYGFGFAANDLGNTEGLVSIYTIVKILKHS